MKRLVVLATFASTCAIAQTVYDSSSLVDTNNTSTSTSTVNSTSDVTSTNTNVNTSTNTNTNTNYNVNSGTQTINNNNAMSGEVTYRNVNTGEMTNNNNNVSTATNTNISTSTSSSTSSSISSSTSANTNVNQNIQSGDMTNRNINESNVTQKVIQPPPTAIAPVMMSGGNTDLCSTGSSSAVQTQILGVSAGGTIRDMNCERLKLSKTLYDMGMKVAAVATMCQDRRVWDAMMSAGTPCPYDGMIGDKARAAWASNPEAIPKIEEAKVDDTYKKVGFGAVLGILLHFVF